MIIITTIKISLYFLSFDIHDIIPPCDIHDLIIISIDTSTKVEVSSLCQGAAGQQGNCEEERPFYIFYYIALRILIHCS